MKRKKKDKQVFYLAGLLWFTAIACILTLLWEVNHPKKSRSFDRVEVAKILGSEDHIELLPHDSNYWQTVPGDSRVYHGDTIMNDSGKVRNIQLRDGRQIKLWPNSALKMNLARVKSKIRFRLSLLSGRLHANSWHLGVKEVDIYAGNEDYMLKNGGDYLDVEIKNHTENTVHRYRKNSVIIR